MNDARLQQLLKLAAEAERLESGDRHFHVKPLSSKAANFNASRILGVAAAVAFAGVIGLLTLKSPTVVQPIDVVEAETPTTPICEQESTVLLALFHKADGIAGRATMALRNWDATRGLNDLAEGELLGIAFEHANDMTPEAMPDSVVLLAVSGPSSLIPHSDAEATLLAACLENTPASCGGEVPCYTSAALSCLPPGVTVRGETRIVR